MRILCIIPPQIPSYFNAGHHLPVFSVSAYLRRIPGVEFVSCVDASALNSTWKEICDLLVQPFNVIAIMNDFDGIDGLARFVSYARTLAPQARLITFGRTSKQVPGFFERYGLDAIGCAGDYEAIVGDYVRFLMEEGASPPAGIALRQEGGYSTPPAGRFLPVEEWVLPEVEEIPYDAYDRMYRNDLNKFCGIPDRRELVVPLARGCPINCAYCDVPKMQGLRERRLPVEQVVDYIEQAFARHPFAYVSFYAPTFTLDKKWVARLCDALIATGHIRPWKCVTTLAYLNEPLIAAMARSGCIRISVGIETFSVEAASSLPKLKRDSRSEFDEIAQLCLRYGVELNCFVILGLPGDSLEGSKATIDHVIRSRARVRPTLYTPYHLMRPDMTEEEISGFNRQLFTPGVCSAEQATEYYRLLFANAADRPTQVMEKIPLRGPRAQGASPLPEAAAAGSVTKPIEA
ncbi:MAG: radical SAM protein [Cystobacter sp.]